MKALIITLLAAMLAAQASKANQHYTHVAGDSVRHAEAATITQFDYHIKNDKIYFHWTVSDNQAADNFELESSADGINFSSKALVFGTDLPQANDYKVFLKKPREGNTYRIRITQKDKTVQYHPIIISVK